MARTAPPTPPRRNGAWAAVLLLTAFVAISFASLDLQWRAFLSPQALGAMGSFLTEFFPPRTDATFLARVGIATWETFAMSALGTLLAAVAAIPAAVAAARPALAARSSLVASLARWLLNVLRAIPELVWAALFVIAAGLGPFAGTLALAAHTAGVLGRLFAEAIENAPSGPTVTLRLQGVDGLRVFLYGTLPQVAPQLLSYTLYRWENNIRAAAILGVVGAGGLGQMLAFHMGLFQMDRTATVVAAMLLLVALVDATSYAMRRAMAR